MDSLYNNQTNKIPYDDTPIFRRNSQQSSKNQKPIKVKVFALMLAIMVVLNVALCITCYTYLQNGKIKNVNIYNDTFSSQEVTYLTDSMRAAKYSTVCIAAGMSEEKQNLLDDNQITTNYEFYHSTKSHGAGFLYKIEGDSAYFVTCFHVINYASDENVAKNTRIWVLPSTMLVPVEVELVSYLEKEDVAVLKYTHNDILVTLEGMVPVSVYDSTFVSEYEDVFTIGNPLNYGLTGTQGKLTAYRQILTVTGVEHAWLKTNAAINPGNSGGPLFNADGQFIGMVNANIPQSSSGDPVSNMAFAIPGTLVLSIADNIIENDLKFSKPLAVNVGINFGVDEIMGIERYKDVYKDQNGEYKDLDQEYVIVKSFDNNSIAKAQGMKVHDRIVSVEIELLGSEETIVVPILNRYTFYEYAFAIKPSSFIKFNIQRQNAQNETESLSISVRATKYS